MDVIDVQAKDKDLVSGFGGFAEIADGALSFYQSVGVPEALVLNGTLHPTGEHLAEHRYLNRSSPDPIGPEDAFTPAQPPVEPGKASLGWITSGGSHPGDQLLQALTAERVAEYDGAINSDQRGTAELENSWQLLQATTPALADDVSKYVKRVALTSSNNFIGLTWTDLGGLVVFGTGAHVAPDKGAESLLHEALHTKSERLTRGFERVYLKEDENRELLNIPWRSHDDTKILWTPARSFDAYFVYAHLTVLRAGLYKHDRSDYMLDALRRVSFRAEYLSNALRSMSGDHIDPQRQEVIAWLDGIRVHAFDLTPAGERTLEQAQLTPLSA